jgi:anti-sigma regulatory factor (Ser/Thr protein kinase)
VCAITPPSELALPSDAKAPRLARSFVRKTMCHPHQARVGDDAQLLVSELVTNALRHGAPPITVRLECEGGTALAVSVSDLSRSQPKPRDAADGDENGRGLALVDFISDRWGYHAHPLDGKVVWFTLSA